MNMLKLITTTEDITRSRSCRVAFNRFGCHQFGGSPSLQYSGIAPPAPIHHLFTLDTNDRRSPIRFEGVRYVPLVYPLAYSAGGGEISYQLHGDNHLEIVDLSEFSEHDPPYFLLDALPERRATLAPLSYAERRILGSDIRDWSFMDRWRMQRLWNGECFRIAGMLEYHSKLGNGPCRSPGNPDGRQCSGWRFAWFPATKRPFGDIWHEYAADVWFCFAVCFDCNTIHAFNECT